MTEFILSLFLSRNKLRVSSLFQLISGKRTTSVLIYSFLNDLLLVHGSFPTLKQEEFLAIITRLEQEKLIVLIDNHASITTLGKKKLEKIDFSYQGVHYDRYGRTYLTCWRLLKFAVQVVSNLTNGTANYLPIETSPFYTFQIKRWLTSTKLNREELSEKIYQEFVTLFTGMPEELADFLANQFSGEHDLGLLPYQLTDKQETQATLFEAKAIHVMLQNLEKRNDFLLFRLLKPLFDQNLNQSMLITRKLILEGYSVEQVMSARQLKKGTVTDHLIEWLLFFDDFPYTTMISKKTVDFLSRLKDVRSWNYREINAQSSLDYGEFRFYQLGLLKGELEHGTDR